MQVMATKFGCSKKIIYYDMFQCHLIIPPTYLTPSLTSIIILCVCAV